MEICSRWVGVYQSPGAEDSGRIRHQLRLTLNQERLDALNHFVRGEPGRRRDGRRQVVVAARDGAAAVQPPRALRNQLALAAAVLMVPRVKLANVPRSVRGGVLDAVYEVESALAVGVAELAEIVPETK